MSLGAWLIAAFALSSAGLGYCLYRTCGALAQARARADAHAQAADEARRELEHFVYLAAHDLQEPVRAIDGFVKLLFLRYKDKLDDDAREFIDYSIEGTERINAMIRGLLTYSRVRARAAAPTAIPLGEIVAEIAAELHCRPEYSTLEVTCQALPTIRGDGARLRTLIRELLLNCAIHGGREGVSRASVRVQHEGSGYRFTVEDDGAGIPPDELEYVFEPFRRLGGRGAGMGFAISRRIVAGHGGDIHAEAADLRGARVVFTLPDT